MMSDFYKCEHGQQMCGTCTRGLKVQYDALEKKVGKLRKVMIRVANQLDDHCSEEQTAPCGMRDELRAALSDGSEQ